MYTMPRWSSVGREEVIVLVRCEAAAARSHARCLATSGKTRRSTDDSLLRDWWLGLQAVHKCWGAGGGVETVPRARPAPRVPPARVIETAAARSPFKPQSVFCKAATAASVAFATAPYHDELRHMAS